MEDREFTALCSTATPATRKLVFGSDPAGLGRPIQTFHVSPFLFYELSPSFPNVWKQLSDKKCF